VLNRFNLLLIFTTIIAVSIERFVNTSSLHRKFCTGSENIVIFVFLFCNIKSITIKANGSRMIAEPPLICRLLP